MTYEVFISYSHRDGPWVQNELLPRLKQEKITYILDEERFTPGASSIKNMADAVRDSRWTLAIYSPDYVASQYCDLELNIAVKLGRDEKRPRVIGMMIEKCALPEWVAIDTYLDFIATANYPGMFARLFACLRGTQADAVAEDTRRAARGLEFLAYLFAKPEFTGPVGQFFEMFEAASLRFAALERYKNLHDGLQGAEHPAKSVENFRKLVELQLGKWPPLKAAVYDLAAHLDKVAALAGSYSLPAHETLWAAALQDAATNLKSAVDRKNGDELSAFLQMVVQEISSATPMLNQKIVSEAGLLGIRQLGEQLGAIRTSLGGYNLEAAAAERLADFDRALEAVERLDWGLKRLVGNHHCLQYVENALRPLTAFIDMPEKLNPILARASMGPLKMSWRTLDRLPGTTWDHEFEQALAGIETAIATPGATPDAEMNRRETLVERITEADTAIRIGFNRTDVDLRGACQQLIAFAKDVVSHFQQLRNGRGAATPAPRV